MNAPVAPPSRTGATGPTPTGSATLVNDAQRAVDLRRMKTIATALFAFAAVVFVLARLAGGEGWIGYVEATAEAAMVGALADWFAVTALFRHPLRLPIPHTAIVPRRKAALGASLGAFVRENFLDRNTVEDRVRSADPTTRLLGWVSEPGAVDRLAQQIVRVVATTAEAVDDAVVTDLLRPAVDAGIRRSDTPRVLARAIDAAIEGGHDQQALDTVLRGVDRLIVENGPLFRERLGDESPWWVPDFVDDRVFLRLVEGIRSFLADVLRSPDHELRRQLTTRLGELSERLRTDPALGSRVEEIRDELLERPELQEWIERFWTEARDDLVAAARSDGSGLARRVADVLDRGVRRLATDEALRRRVDDALVRAAGSATEIAGPEIADLIAGTVDRWDADDTSRRIELQIGRDLQFIRINGTVVGGLAGLVIHALAELA